MNRFGITEANPPRDDDTLEIVSTLARAAVEGRTLCDVNSLMTALLSFVRYLVRLVAFLS